MNCSAPRGHADPAPAEPTQVPSGTETPSSGISFEILLKDVRNCLQSGINDSVNTCLSCVDNLKSLNTSNLNQEQVGHTLDYAKSHCGQPLPHD